MKLTVLAVGQRMPAWADAAWDDFSKRFPPEMRLELKAIKAEPRSGRNSLQCMKAEADRLQAACSKGSRRVVLDERGDRLSTAALSLRVEAWRSEGRDVSFFIGGPDGLAPEIRESADELMRLSDLTLPHALVRVMLAEALYRAWMLHIGHPYHRE